MVHICPEERASLARRGLGGGDSGSAAYLGRSDGLVYLYEAAASVVGVYERRKVRFDTFCMYDY